MPITRRRLSRDIDGRRIIANIELREADGGVQDFVTTYGPFGKGRLSPAWSITGEVYEPHGTGSGGTRERAYANGKQGPANEPDMCGCIHEEILAAFPHLAPFVALHLSAPDGTPMHAEANGWYFVSGEMMSADAKAAMRDGGALDGYNGAGSYSAAWIAKYHEKAAKLWRCAVEDVPPDPGGQRGSNEHRATIEAFVDAQRERWRQEAADARVLLESLSV